MSRATSSWPARNASRSLPEVGVRRQESAAVGLAALLERLDVGQEDLVPPLLAVGVAGEFMCHGPTPPGREAARGAASARGRAGRRPPGGVRPICSRHVGHREPLQVVQLHDPPLVLRQTGRGRGRAAAAPRRGRPARSATSGRPRAGPPAGTPTAPARPPAIVPGRDRAPGCRTAGPRPPGRSPGWRGARPATRLRSGPGTGPAVSWACRIACWTTSEASSFARGAGPI